MSAQFQSYRTSLSFIIIITGIGKQCHKEPQQGYK